MIDSRNRMMRVEAALWTVLGTLAFLAKDNPRLVYPNVLYLFVSLLVSSLSTSLAIRTVPGKPWVHALTLLAGLASISGLQLCSGGTESSLWVLYLLPLFTSAILLSGRETAWVAAGACASNAALYAASSDSWGAAASFELSLKTGVLVVAAAATWALSRAEREAEARSASQRLDIQRLERRVEDEAQARERDRGLAEIAAFGAGAVHDLGAPLMVMRAYARIHLDRGIKDEELARDLARIEKAAAFCMTLVSRLLERDSAPATPQVASEIAETALSMAEPLLKAQHVEIRREYSEEALKVLAPSHELERVLLNLLGNAAKSMTRGGCVTVRIARADLNGVPSAAVTVEDGPGIAKEILPRLFQAFATTRAGRGGTGLGLFMSRETLRRHGGSLDAENRSAGGARFTLRMPLMGMAAAV
jgi:signal transduction histidine kinase